MKLTIDSRETALITEFKQFKEINAEVSPLLLGDVLIETDECIYLMERKTKADFASSIIDGRYREQKERLINFRENSKSKTCKVVYIIEDSKYNTKYTTHIRTATSSFIIESGFYTLNTKNVKDTAETISNFCKRCTNTKTKGESYNNLKFEKKNSTYSTFTKMLCVIDGISMTTSQAIENSGVNSIQELSEMLNTAEGEANLLGIMITNKRKMSKNLIDKLKKELLKTFSTKDPRDFQENLDGEVI